MMKDAVEVLRSALADRCSVERELGVGGMAVVCLTQDLKHSRKVAIKVFRRRREILAELQTR